MKDNTIVTPRRGRPRKANPEPITGVSLPLSAKRALNDVRWEMRNATGRSVTFGDTVAYLVGLHEQRGGGDAPYVSPAPSQPHS